MTSPAWGMPAAPMAASVAVSTMVICATGPSGTPKPWAMNSTATASYSAVPSMLIVAPKGSTNSVERRETPALVSAHSMVTGKVAVLLAVENAVKTACDMALKKCHGFRRVKIHKRSGSVTTA